MKDFDKYLYKFTEACQEEKPFVLTTRKSKKRIVVEDVSPPRH